MGAGNEITVFDQEFAAYNQGEVTICVDRSEASSQPSGGCETSASQGLATTCGPGVLKCQIVSTPLVLEHPDGVSARTVAVAGGVLAALEAKPAWDQPVRGLVLLLPGFTGSKEDFTGVLAPLAALGWWAVAVDQRGQHESTGPNDLEAYRLLDFSTDARDAIAVLRGDLGEEDLAVHLVGHSFGGLVAREAALQSWSDGDRDGLQSLTLLCSGPAALPAASQAALGELVAALPATSLELIWTIVRTRSNEALNGDPITDFLRRRFLANNPWALKSIGTILRETPDRTDELAALVAASREDRKVLVAYGESDDAWPLEWQDDMARRLGTMGIPIPDAGHSPAAETHASAAATVALLDAFWSGSHPAQPFPGRDAV